MNDVPRLPAPVQTPLLSPPGDYQPLKPARGRVPKPVFAGAGVLLVALLAVGVWTHVSADLRAAEAQRAQADFRPLVRVALAKRQEGPVTLTLPGTTAAYDQANLYARATGYVAERRVDIGARVKQGDLLLRIASPDLDAQLAQALAQVGQTQAALAQAQAQVDGAKVNVDLANKTNYRTSTLAKQGWETRQNADNSQTSLSTNSVALATALAGVKVAEANRAAQLAEVRRLTELTGYERVTAPFDGVITARNVDTGDLVTANAGGGAPALSIQRDDVVRVRAYVPQSGAFGIAEGVPVKVSVPERPGKSLDGTVARSASALDPASRTLLVEADVPNPERLLHPGSFVQVSFAIPRTAPGVVVPAEAVLFGADGLRVAVIGDDGVAHLRHVTVGRDFGTSVELTSGLEGGERVALQPPANLADGQAVRLPDAGGTPAS